MCRVWVRDGGVLSLLVVPVCDDKLHVWRNASCEDVLMMDDFLDDFTVAMAWVLTGSPEEAFDLVFRKYVGFAREDFSLQLVCVQVRGGV
jgi:hypothetical protein